MNSLRIICFSILILLEYCQLPHCFASSTQNVMVIKKFKIRVTYKEGKSEIVYIEAPSSNQAIQKAKKLYPNAVTVNSVGI